MRKYMKEYSRVYAEIDLDRFEENLDRIEERLSAGTGLIAVVKADGYGHGAVELSSEVLEKRDRIKGYATASLDEALVLAPYIKKPILILGYTFPEQYPALIEKEIRPTIFEWESAVRLSETAVALGCIAKIHIKLDTGMGRIGYRIDETSADEIVRISQLPGIEIEGIFTHFARADETDKTAAHKQITLYEQMIQMLLDRGLTIPIHHMANSAGILELPASHADLARAGIILYGLSPSGEVGVEKTGIRPILTLKSRVIYVKELPAGSAISYGGTYVTERDARIATVPVGYGDGYPRSLSSKGCVLIHGKKAPICGRVCMDQFMVDVTDIPDVRQGDEVILIGEDGGEAIRMDELGDISGRFNYELACDLGKRIPRTYIKNGNVVRQRDYFSA